LALTNNNVTLNKRNAILTTDTSAIPRFLASNAQVIRFGTSLEFIPSDSQAEETDKSAVVLPCIFGTQMQGPMLLATGKVPSNIPFSDEKALCAYYEQLESIAVVVDERMTDNARNLATGQRLNALFIVKVNSAKKPDTADKVVSALSSANINAVTALAGPQSLIVANIDDSFYFYRGLADPKILDTSKLDFGADITDTIKSAGVKSLLVPNVPRLIKLGEDNTIVLPYTSQVVKPQDLAQIFEQLSINKINTMHDDITAAVPQLQALMSQKDLQNLSKGLIDILSAKIDKAVGPMRRDYIQYVATEFNIDNRESVLKKNRMLGELRKATKETQAVLEPVISSLSNMLSSQTTSKRTHDMKRLVRQTQIQNNVEATKSMTFESMTGLLESHAEEMGVMLVNIETLPYKALLSKLTSREIDARYVLPVHIINSTNIA
jgi:hypothetical protein